MIKTMRADSIELADLDAARDYPGSRGVWTRGLLIRRSLAEQQDLAFFATWCPRGTSIETLVSEPAP